MSEIAKPAQSGRKSRLGRTRQNPPRSCSQKEPGPARKTERGPSWGAQGKLPADHPAQIALIQRRAGNSRRRGARQCPPLPRQTQSLRSPSSRISRRRPESRGRTGPRPGGASAREGAGPGLTTEGVSLEDSEERTTIPENRPQSEVKGIQQLCHQGVDTERKSPQGQVCHKSVSVSD